MRWHLPKFDPENDADVCVLLALLFFCHGHHYFATKLQGQQLAPMYAGAIAEDDKALLVM